MTKQPEHIKMVDDSILVKRKDGTRESAIIKTIRIVTYECFPLEVGDVIFAGARELEVVEIRNSFAVVKPYGSRRSFLVNRDLSHLREILDFNLMED